MRGKWLGLGLALLSMACSGGSGSAKKPTADSPKAAAQALMRSVTLAGGTVKKGGLPAASDDTVMLLPQPADTIEPGTTTIMSLDVDNPNDADNPGKAVLMQFEGASDHLETPVSSSKSGAGDLNFEILVGDDVCADLCNKSFNVTLQMALALVDGTVGAHTDQSLTLDCKKKGDAARCASAGTSGSAGSSGSSKGGTGGTAAHPKDAGTTSTGMPDGGAERDAGVGVGFDASGLFPDGGLPFDAAAFLRDGGPAFDANGLYPEAGFPGDGGVFPCLSGGTVGFDKLCDGKNDCSDGYDEMICVPCMDGMGKYSPLLQCDGKMACADGTDEMGCSFTCMNGQQIPTQAFCDGKNDCSDGSDETPCQFQCGDGTSVSETKVCDGKSDCANGADEAKPMCP